MRRKPYSLLVSALLAALLGYSYLLFLFSAPRQSWDAEHLFDASTPPRNDAIGRNARSTDVNENVMLGAANRAPPWNVVVTAAQGAAWNGSVACWDVQQRRTSCPLWAAPLVQSTLRDGVFDVVSNLTIYHPWAVLVGWMPARFMPPQRPGRKASGDVIEAPTRGRDATRYHRLYNASWVTRLVLRGEEYWFQLVHRNALAVCIRERLHLYAFDLCIRDCPDRVLRVHFCPCRHCVMSTEPSRAVSRDSFPTMPRMHKDVRCRPTDALGRNRSRRGLPTSADVWRNGQCLPCAVAPWLCFPASIFSYDSVVNNLTRLLELRSNAAAVVVVVLFNQYWVDHLHNFIVSLVWRGGEDCYVVAAMDEDSLRVCVENHLPCFNASLLAEREVIEKGKGATRKVSEAMSWLKPRLVERILLEGYSAMLCDLDISVNSAFVEEVAASAGVGAEDGGVDLVHQCDAPSAYSINSGFYFARCGTRSVAYFRHLMFFNVQENSDQTAMRLFARYDHTHRLRNRCVPPRRYDMKCHYKVQGSGRRRGGGVETFRWRPFERHRSSFRWSILHATCLNGAMAKWLYLRTMHAWFLDDLDAITSSLMGYCVELPNGTTVAQQSEISTVHSRGYSTGMDERYLLSRH